VQEQVGSLVRRMTSQSTSGDTLVNPFESSDDPAYDPNSGQFNAEAWAKALLRIQSRDPEKYPKRTAGVSFRNLNVHGWGTPTDYQKDVGNVLLEGPALFNKALGKGKRKIQILRDFDGLIKSGEMLIVLGRPGRYATIPLNQTEDFGDLILYQRVLDPAENYCWRDTASVSKRDPSLTIKVGAMLL
jgi:ATP-binding cassette, subfamily G (WHITE), member 2, PDR